MVSLVLTIIAFAGAMGVPAFLTAIVESAASRRSLRQLWGRGRVTRRDSGFLAARSSPLQSNYRGSSTPSQQTPRETSSLRILGASAERATLARAPPRRPRRSPPPKGKRSVA
jgi:hypothetical protein